MGIHYGKSDFITYGKPSLFLDFANKKSLKDRISGNDLITFTRSSTATYLGSDGLIKTAAANVPRFDHNSSGTCLGYLTEESRTNLITYSEQFDNAAWTKQNAGITTNTSVTTAPDGSTNAEKLVENTSNGEHRFYQGISASSGTTYTFSCFLKAAERSWVEFGIQDPGGGVYYRFFNISTGVSGSNANNSNYTITNYSNNWYRISLTFTALNTGTLYGLIWAATSDGTASYTGDGTSGIYMWGAQLEAGSFPTSYIPTVASTVTRSGDLAYIDLPSGNWYNYSQGSLVFQHSTVPYGGPAGYPAIGFAQTSGSSQNAIQYFFDRSNGVSQYLVRNSNTDQATIQPSTPQGMTAGKVGFAYATNSFVLVRNGSQVGTDTSGTVPQSIGTFGLGIHEKNSANNINSCISKVVYYPTALSSSQLQQLTQ